MKNLNNLFACIVLGGVLAGVTSCASLNNLFHKADSENASGSTTASTGVTETVKSDSKTEEAQAEQNTQSVKTQESSSASQTAQETSETARTSAEAVKSTSESAVKLISESTAEQSVKKTDTTTSEAAPSKTEADSTTGTEQTEQTEQTAQPKEKAFSRREFLEKVQSTLETGTVEQAIALFDTLPEKEKRSYDLLFIKASLLVSAEKYDDAEALCNMLKKYRPDDVDLMELSAVIDKAKGNKSARSEQLKAILAKDPDNAAANVQMGEDCLLAKNYKGAEDYFDKVLAKDPENEDALVGYGRAAYFKEEDDKAYEKLNKAISVNPDNDGAYYYRAKIHSANNEYKEAVADLDKAVKLQPDNYDYLLDYGMNLRYTGKYDKAMEVWTKAISIEPDYFLGYVFRAGLNDETDRYTEALADYKMVVKLNPGYTAAYECIGILDFHLKNYREAGNMFLKARSYDKKNISYPLLITYCFNAIGDNLNAKKFAESAYKGMDQSTIEYKMLRAYHDKAGEQNIIHLIPSIKSNSMRSKMYFYLGLYYDMLNFPGAAQEYYAHTIQINDRINFEYRMAQWRSKEILESEK